MCEMDSLVIGPEMVDGHIQFGALSKLDLSCNQLETGQLRALGRLRNLTYLDLSHNQLPEVLRLAKSRLSNMRARCLLWNYSINCRFFAPAVDGCVVHLDGCYRF